jgi:hypothetical protein
LGLAAVVAFGLSAVSTAEARHGSFGSHGSFGGAFSRGSNGSHGSFGGMFSRGSNGSRGSFGGLFSRGSHGSHGGCYSHDCGCEEKADDCGCGCGGEKVHHDGCGCNGDADVKQSDESMDAPEEAADEESKSAWNMR